MVAKMLLDMLGTVDVLHHVQVWIELAAVLVGEATLPRLVAGE